MGTNSSNLLRRFDEFVRSLGTLSGWESLCAGDAEDPQGEGNVLESVETTDP